MDKYWKHNYCNSLPEDNKRYIRDQNPSFSSTLLDEIYRSIDDRGVADGDESSVLYRETLMKKKKQYIHTTVEPKYEANFQRIENWMDKMKAKNCSEKTIKTHADQRKNGEKYGGFVDLSSSWSSSGSSSGGLFSSEAESNYGVSSRSSSSTSYRPKPIRTSTDNTKKISHNNQGEGVVKRSKLKELKMYGDLKKVKQPISPGAKLSSFLNSLFTTAKKGKISGVNSSNTSPASSTSRSCLTKTPSKLSNNGTKRSVRFYPVSVIVDEDCQPCGHKYLQRQDLAVSDQRNCTNEELMYHIRSKNQSVEEAARELLKNYQRKVEHDDDDDDDDDDSYASSDLFELDNLNNNNTGMGNYMEELPVYETTYLHTNRGLIV